MLLVGCAQPTPLLRPNGVAVASDGSLYVMDRGNYRVVHFSADGQVLGTFGKFGLGPGDIHTGWDMALDSQGNVYICHFVFSEEDDLIHDGVKVFRSLGYMQVGSGGQSSGGQFLREIGGQDYTPGDGRLPYKPYGLDIDQQDRVYVADFDTNTVRIFDSQGLLLGKFFGDVGTGDGQFNGANDVAVDDTRGLLYVSDNINSRVQQFALAFTDTEQPGVEAPTLTYLRSFGDYGDGPGQLAYPQGLAVDETSGSVYVADHANQRIQAFNPEGEALIRFAPPDVHIWQVLLLAVGNEGRVYATDGYNNVVWVFEADGTVNQRIEVVQ